MCLCVEVESVFIFDFVCNFTLSAFSVNFHDTGGKIDLNVVFTNDLYKALKN